MVIQDLFASHSDNTVWLYIIPYILVFYLCTSISIISSPLCESMRKAGLKEENKYRWTTGHCWISVRMHNTADLVAVHHGTRHLKEAHAHPSCDADSSTSVRICSVALPHQDAPSVSYSR